MYNSYFGFRESPFSVTPDPRFFYTNPVYLEAFAILRYGIEAKKGFIVITGEVGTGKTTLLRKLLDNFEDTIHSVFIFNSCLSFPELLEFTLQDLGLAPKAQSKVAMLQELNDYLLKQLRQGHTVTMLIDESQNLSDEVLENLRLLSNLETAKEKLIQIVLMGQPELETKLSQPHLRQLKQRVALKCRLHPLAGEEVRPYIDARLSAAGYEGHNLFLPNAVEQIAYFSKGIPRVVNIICDNALLSAYAAGEKIVSADVVEALARDLDLASEPPFADGRDLPIVLPPMQEEEIPLRQTPNGRFQYITTPLIRAGFDACLMMFVLIAVSAIIDSRHLFNVAQKGLASFGYGFSTWAAPMSQTEAPAKRPHAKVDSNPAYKRITIQPGSTIQRIAADTYGANTTLGMELIKEFNPQIQNLNRVLPGQELLLVPLSEETLLREQGDGSYHFTVGSFSNSADADAYARALGKEGFQVTITPNRVSDNLSLHRVEIVGLKNLREAMQTWNTGLSKGWFAFAKTPNAGDQISKAEIVY